MGALVESEELSAEVVHFERFGVQQSSKGAEVSVMLSKTGRTLRVKRDQTLLTALIRAGVNVSYDCMRGECGMCAVNYRDGVVTHRDSCLSDASRKDHLCLCVSQVESDKIVLGI